MPLRVAPQPGESLTSWLCAYAQRNDVTWREMLTATGLHCRAGDMEYIGWACRLHSHEIDALSDATGIDSGVLRAMTLDHFAARGLRIVRRPTRTRRGALNRITCLKRFCPQCLRENEARWQLAWSLEWTFACTRHQCLLVDTCPRCLRAPMRPAPLIDKVPDLTRCTQSADRHGHTICGADLTACTPELASPELITAQQVINDVVAGDTAAFTVYDPVTRTPAHVVADLRSLADDIAQTRFRSTDITRIAPVADSFAAATHVLQAPDIATAATRLRNHITASAVIGVARRAGLAYDTSTRHALAGAIELAALDTELPVADALRYRTCTAVPRTPRRPAAALATLTRGLPTLLWPAWATYILDEGPEIDTAQRAALACLAAHVGTDTRTPTISTMLGNTVADFTELLAAMRALRRRQDRADVLNRVIVLADQLSAIPTAIDYHRRRRLDYTHLLATIENRRRDRDPLRCVAFEYLSGLPRAYAPWFRDTERFAHMCSAIVAEQALSEPAVTEGMGDFLRYHGIEEPIIAMPALPQRITS
ncbi:TniQ family protein [Mycolicibacterium fluoranthenivorans]|uniref:TniQ family protein n=1 Tax=Mycolicibacterium fluoranthenivorans TaxID=258505 RepID=A0A7G8PKK5_9MYCO|nr:TniQ family protein [Mycolicibacterium fluoranthenivorans]QNJ94871.1 TniQ family protein [Mycolicibacterium fluoranthenivorans]